MRETTANPLPEQFWDRKEQEMEPAGQKSSHDTQHSMREVVEQEPLLQQAGLRLEENRVCRNEVKL